MSEDLDRKLWQLKARLDRAESLLEEAQATARKELFDSIQQYFNDYPDGVWK